MTSCGVAIPENKQKKNLLIIKDDLQSRGKTKKAKANREAERLLCEAKDKQYKKDVINDLIRRGCTREEAEEYFTHI